MEKIFLKPTSKEIAIKGNSKEGHTDVFAYDFYDDDSKRKLGGLYIVSNVKRDSDLAIDTDKQDNSPDIAYVTNLVASLAKREYYSKPDISSQDAFSATLKKINDVVEEFFKNKALKVNIGIFAITGEQILISKLGKFKIILGRNSRTIDILNNIDLFSKDPAEEKGFSGVVSGKVVPGDKLFAFYPNRMIMAREKTIKADLLKFDAEQFLEKINSIKEVRPDFDCRALYLSLNNHKEPAAKKPKLVASTKPASSSLLEEKPRQEGISIDTAKLPNATKDKKQEIYSQGVKEEVPRIISSEFSLGRKVNPLLTSMMTPIKIMRDLCTQSANLKRKFIVLSLVAGILGSGVVLIKIFVVLNPEQRQLNEAINQSQNNLKLVRTKISQNDFIGARQLLVDSLSSIYAVDISNDQTEKTIREIYEILDNIDKAIDVSPSLLETMPDELSQRVSVLTARTKEEGIAFDIYENNLYILKSDGISKIANIDKGNDKEIVQWLKSGTLPTQPSIIAVDGNIYVMNNSGTIATFYKGAKVSEINTFIISNSNDVLLTSANSKRLYLINKNLARIYELDKETKSLIRTLKVGSSEPFVDAYLYGDNTIIITAKDGRIWEIK